MKHKKFLHVNIYLLFAVIKLFSQQEPNFNFELKNGGIFEFIRLQNSNKLICVESIGNLRNPAHRLSRWNIDGTIDNSFSNNNMMFKGEMRQMEVLPNGNIVILGTFTNVNNLVVEKSFILISKEGDEIQYIDVNDFDFHEPRGVFLYPLGEYILLHNIYSFTGEDHSEYRKSYLLDMDFKPLAGFAIDYEKLQEMDYILNIYFAALLEDKLYIVLEKKGSKNKAIIRLNPDGSIDNTFNKIELEHGEIAGIVIHNNKLIIGGSFYLPERHIWARVSRYSLNGILDESFIGINYDKIPNNIKQILKKSACNVLYITDNNFLIFAAGDALFKLSSKNQQEYIQMYRHGAQKIDNFIPIDEDDVFIEFNYVDMTKNYNIININELFFDEPFIIRMAKNGIPQERDIASVYRRRIDEMNSDERRLLRNAVFALYGYKFKSTDLFDYYSQFDWYNPNIIDASIIELSNSQQELVEYILSIQNQ